MEPQYHMGHGDPRAEFRISSMSSAFCSSNFLHDGGISSESDPIPKPKSGFKEGKEKESLHGLEKERW